MIPPVSKLSPAQAMYHFISGYTAKVAGTEVGVTEPTATFSPCFGGPFMGAHKETPYRGWVFRSEKPNAEGTPRSTGASIIINGRYAPPPEDKDGKLWVRTSANVQASPEDLYALWRDVENAPLWQEQIESVEVLGPTTSRWTMRTGNSQDV